jgi:poly-D-alanine transfer protein DltD
MKRSTGIAALLREGFSNRDPFDAEADACFAIEYLLHQKIDGDYPVSKYMIECEQLEELAKRKGKNSSGSNPMTMGNQI